MKLAAKIVLVFATGVATFLGTHSLLAISDPRPNYYIVVGPPVPSTALRPLGEDGDDGCRWAYFGDNYCQKEI